MKPLHPLKLVIATAALFMIGMPLYASKIDHNIELSARKSYVFKTYLKADDIKIRSRDGVVTLMGTVSEESHKSLAEATVESLPGVKSVDNRLEVTGEHPAEGSDAWLKAKVKIVLLFHENVSAGKTEVDVKDGIVTLRGHAASEAQKELTAEYVKDVGGVKDVRNEMTAPKTSKTILKKIGEKIDDASITALVKLTLFYHRSTSALNTKVETNRGVVTLRGKAGNGAEKDLVTKLVSDIRGVKSVKNEMIVEAST